MLTETYQNPEAIWLDLEKFNLLTTVVTLTIKQMNRLTNIN